jgi:hypothetical protein
MPSAIILILVDHINAFIKAIYFVVSNLGILMSNVILLNFFITVI